MKLKRSKRVTFAVATGMIVCLAACGSKQDEIHTFYEGVTLAPTIGATAPLNLTEVLLPTGTVGWTGHNSVGPLKAQCFL